MRIPLLLIACLALPAAAETAYLSWAPPDSRLDGQPLYIQEIAHYDLFVYLDDGLHEIIEIDGSTVDLVYDKPAHVDGTLSVAMTVTDTDGVESPHTERRQL